MAKKRTYDYYVYSTLSANMDYTIWKQGGGDLPAVAGTVRIGGHANVADKHFDTPLGVSTGISSSDLELLKVNPTFLLHEQNGYIIVKQADDDIETVVADMEGRDQSAPLVPQDFEAAGQEAPKTTSSRKA